MESNPFTPSIRIDTGIPFPHNKEDVGVSLSESKGPNVIAEVCSELTDYHAQVAYFEKNGRIRLVHDHQSLPIVFTLSGDSALLALRYGSHAVEGWASANIGPAGAVVTGFDVSQVGSILYVAVSCKVGVDEPYHSLYHCAIDVSAEEFDFHDEAEAQKDGKGLGWELIPDNANPDFRVGKLVISSLLCKVVMENNAFKAFQVVVATTAHGTQTATHYLVETDSNDGDYWTSCAFPVPATQVLQTEPLVLGNFNHGFYENGILSVCRDSEQLRCVGQICAKGGFSRSFEYKVGELGGINSAFSHLNPWNMTDVFLAGEKGIGFCSYQKCDELAVKPILPEISFKQVIASEASDPEDVDNQTKLAIFAVSEDDCLYFIEGTRNFSEAELEFTFTASGFPIRSDVTHISARYNATHGTNELLYAAKRDNALFFLRRNPGGLAWTEDKITRPALQYLKFDAYITTIVLTDGCGNHLPPTHPIQLTAECLHAVANGRSVTLSKQPIFTNVDHEGCLMVAIPTQSKLGCQPFKVTLAEIDDVAGRRSFDFDVDPALRVNRLLGTYDSAEKLRDATSGKGEAVFKDTDFSKLEKAAFLLTQFNQAKGSIASSGTGLLIEPPAERAWWEEAVDVTENFLGEVIEAVKRVVKGGVKLMLRAFGPVVKVVLEIAGKVISVVVEGLYSLLECIGTGLETVFGWDGLSKFLKLLKLAVDPASIAATQRYISEIVTGGLEFTNRAIGVVKDSVMDIFADGREVLKEHIDDIRDPSPPGEFTMPRWISVIFNNPLIRLLAKINPIAWVMEAIQEEVADSEMQLPDFDKLFGKLKNVASGALGPQTEIFTRLFVTLLQQVHWRGSPQQILASFKTVLKSGFWTLFDSAESLVEHGFQLISVFLEGLQELLVAEWHIPGLTDVWVDITGQRFSIMRFMTYQVSVMVNLTSLINTGALPKLPTFDWSSISVKQFYTSGAEVTNSSTMHQAKGNAVLDTTFDQIVPLSVKHAAINRMADGSVTSQARMKEKVFPMATSRILNEQNNNAPVAESDGAHTVQLIIEALGKVMSGVVGVSDTYGAFARARRQGIQNAGQIVPGVEVGPQPIPNPAPAPRPRRRLAQVVAFFRGAGPAVQGIGLIIAAIINDDASPVTARKRKYQDKSNIALAVIGVFELFLLVTGSMDNGTELFLGLSELCGQVGTIIRITVVERRWGLTSKLSLPSASFAIGRLGINVLSSCRWARLPPDWELYVRGAGLVCAVGDVTSGFAACVAAFSGED